MSVFNDYAQYYDLIYKDKDYAGETHFIDQLIQDKAPGLNTVLDLGCGTGRHAAGLVKIGYEVCGVDISEQMLDSSHRRLNDFGPDLASKLTFAKGDIRDVRLNQKFDVVLSLFHVICYQTRNADLKAAFETAKKHLKPNGLFIFDAWYGPAVLSDLPGRKEKTFAGDGIEVSRISESVVRWNENLVDVNYCVSIRKNGSPDKELKELHTMRYLFMPEVETLLSEAGMKAVKCGEWMTQGPPGLDTWSVYWVASL